MKIVLIKSYTNKPWRSPATYQLIEEGLSEKWAVESINTKSPEVLHKFLTEKKQKHGGNIFVFNIAEYLDEENKTGFLPALLEEWQIPHLGSSATAIALGLDKAKTKDLLVQQGVATPRYFVATPDDDDIQTRADAIGYPLIAKPNAEGGHIGITEDSIINDYAGLEKLVKHIFATHNQAALVEDYISGAGMREFSVGILDSQTTQLFTPIEIDFAAMDVKKEILSSEIVQDDLEQTKLVQDKRILATLIDLTKKTFAAVGACDYSRVDLRMDATTCYVLEINIMPGLGLHSFLPTAAKDIHGLSYGQLIRKLAGDSMQRQKVG